ncbi:MAG: site-specific DNA-methyltransferase [Proteobacteria bacterium]|nr:site-specific DNA-methyltransferase [Pseudomonadota bacterium]MBU1569417.1 site-specific DNA-methyltransferase [Pseudomonadota bacterium]
MNKHKIYIADSRLMQEVPDESVHLVITSPPYWQLKDYDSALQIGFHDTYEEYINNLNLVWKECHRVLYGGCRLCVNIGDQFARSVYYGRYKVIPIRTEIIKFCESIGFDYMGAIIWHKVTTCNTTGGATIMGSYPYPRNGIVKINYEFILLFKKIGVSPPASKEAKEQSRLSVKEWNEYFAGHWNFPGEKQDKHLAMFPEELPRRLISMFSFVGEMVLDPFLGSGTTSLAAKRLQRHSIGYEINESFLPVIRKKIGAEQADIFSQTVVEVIKPALAATDYRQEIQKLPYIFHDPVQFDKKIDPRKLSFGSKIEANGNGKVKYLHLKSVIAPNTIELNNDMIIRLIGIETKAGKELEAMKWLSDKLKGKSIYLKFDKTKYDDDNRLLSYLYLKNKTFINLHFLRSNLVRLDETFPFKYHDKFKAVIKEEIRS